MQYANLVYSLLINQFWSITPALPTGSAGTRPDVGFPEIIPDKTFISRELNATDGFPTAQRNHLNGFIQGAKQFHLTYGLAPITVNSFEDILNHFQALTAPVGRFRLVSHGNDSFLFFPIFNGGLWSYGMHTEYLQALQDNDEGGLRYVISGSPPSNPLLIDGVNQIVDGIRSINSALLAPLGLATSRPLTGEVKKFIEIVNDLYQVQNGTIAANADGNPPNVLLSAAQQAIITASLVRIENAIRGRLVGTTIGTTTITATHLDDFKTAVMAATPIELEFLGSSFSLSPNVIADVTTAMAAVPRVESDLRTAISGGSGPPLFRDYLGSLIAGVKLFDPTKLNLGGTDHEEASIRANADLEAFVLTCIDLHFLKNGPLFISGSALNAAQRTDLRNAIVAISDMVRTKVTTATPAITITQLNALRTKMENISLRQSAITGGWMTMPQKTFTELAAANQAMQNNFRTKLDHFRGLMQAADASKIDIRGCLVGKTPAFLVVLRNFFGTTANKPTINAPEWFQSFPFAFTLRTSTHPTNTNIAASIDALVTNGIAADHISDVDVDTAITTWRGLIDFDPHFDFITALFAPAASKRDFATLGWRAWRAGLSTIGIPMLRMQAKRIDDLNALSLGDIIERFRVIFEVPPASAPNTAARGRLNLLQPHLVTFKTKSDAVAAGPAPAALTQLAADLTALAGSIAGIAGFPAPAAPLPPASASLADIQTSVTNIGGHLDTILNNELNPFFAAIQAKAAHVNVKIRYYYNIGLPLLLQSSSQPTSFAVSTFIGAISALAANTLAADVLRSWMRIQWKGSAAQATVMNTVIQSFAITNDTQRTNASQVSMLSREDPIDVPTTEAGICPTQTFHDHLVTRP
jgi:hypothetical protein